MTDFNAAWALIGLLVGCTAGIGGLAAMLALGSIGRASSVRRRRTRACVKAWSRLLPGWKPDADQLEALDAGPWQLQAAYGALAEGWDRADARWDVLIAVLVYTRREALRMRVDAIKAHAAEQPPVRMVRS